MNKISLDIMFNAIAGAPLWVWGILAYLLFVGIKATRTRIVYIPKLFIIPTVFIALNYKNLISGENIIKTLGFMLIGFIIGFVIGNNIPIKIIKGIKSIELPGNYSTIVILILFFIMKYVFGYLHAVHPSIAIQYAYVDAYVSALFSGLFLGRALCYLYRFYNE